uniref:Uncharacterized protein n=1 Tax=Melanopsichium pennsylvanicum 4 TaxID=1398559 RepID=A0A077REK2_9BASI|nr:uncharacterized protein BN887_06336 [Melanopsichium pennsylvanicum 4]
MALQEKADMRDLALLKFGDKSHSGLETAQPRLIDRCWT